MRLLTVLFWAVLAYATPSAPEALADKRVALVIGNSDYQNVAKLPNPAKDAEAIAALLRKAGFDVVEGKRNLNVTQMRRAVRDFSDAVQDADIALVFYAGHGMEVDGNNYLLPVDAQLDRDTDVEDEGLSLDRIVRAMEPVKRLRVVILDACRDNPFQKSMKRTLATRSISRGLGKVEVEGSDTLIAFAAKAGSTAADGDGEHSPFTMGLLHNLAVPGLDLRLAFGRVRDEVLKSTGKRQEPFVYGSLGGSTVSLVPAPAVVAAPAPAANATAGMRHDFELAGGIGTTEAWDQFLLVYNDGLYAGLARAARAKIVAERDRMETEARASAARTEAAAKVAIAKAQAEAEAAAAAAKAETLSKADAGAKAAIAKAQAEAKAAVAKSEAEARATAQKAEAALATMRAEAAAKLEQANKALDAERAKLATQQVAALVTQDELPSAAPSPTGGALIQEIKKELKRVGCYTGKLDNEWKSSEVKHSLAKFAKIASLAKTPEEPDAKFLNTLRGQITRVCPIECGKSEVELQGKCVAKVAPTPRAVHAQADRGTSDINPAAPIGPGGRRQQDMRWQSGGDTRVKCGKYGCSTWKRQ